jgi:tetratricopeptide (TPR) repeat protein
MNMRIAVLTAMLLGSPLALAASQSAAEHIAIGDRDHAAMNVASALQHYEAAISAEPRNYEALWKASRDAVEAGEFNASKDEQTRLYKLAEDYAKRAVEVMPNDAEGHFSLARAIGRNALRMGKRDRVKFAGVVRTEALEALKYSPKHPGALHVMGLWNAEVMRLSGFSRMMAKTFLGGKVFDQASWKEAVRYMEEAVAADPDRLTHRLDLGKIYADTGDKGKAREQFERVMSGTATEHNDRFYKLEAERQLKELQ